MEIDKKTARKLYAESPDWFKEQLENEFCKDYLSSFSYDEIKTFEDACDRLGITKDKLFNENDTPDEIAYKKLKIITRAINTTSAGKTWEPDWKNTDQRKWWPWFVLSSGFGFSHSICSCDLTYASVGSRLCFETKEQSDYAATRFIDIYEQFLTIKK